jgi:uncharacterized membrane protein YbhN (UPF0104 family)
MSFGLLLVALWWAFRFLWEDREALRSFWEVPWYQWILPTAIYLGTLALKSMSFDFLTRAFGVRVPLMESVGLTASGLLSNYALPGNVALPLRSAYLHRVHGLHYQRFLPLALAAFAFSTGLYGSMLGIAGLINGPVDSTVYLTVMLFLSCGGVVLIVVLLLPYHRIRFVGGVIERFLASWRLFVGLPTLFAPWLATEFLRAALEIGFFYSIMRNLSVESTLSETAIIVLAKECSVFFRLTPGAFGIAEGVQAFFAVAFGIDPARVVFAAIIARIIELVSLGITAALLLGRLTRRIKERA